MDARLDATPHDRAGLTPMDAFSYLSVLLSIILGLAITQVLQGFRGLMLARSRLRAYGPCLLWALILLVMDVQAWWAMYGLRERTDWTFLAFAAVLAQTVPLYLLAGLVLPDAGNAEAIDLRRHYYENHRWFFAMLVLLLVISIVKPVVLLGELTGVLDLAFQLAFIVAALVGAWTANERYHRILAPTAAAAVAIYITLLFAHLH
jgi:hypothetical protein